MAKRAAEPLQPRLLLPWVSAAEKERSFRPGGPGRAAKLQLTAVASTITLNTHAPSKTQMALQYLGVVLRVCRQLALLQGRPLSHVCLNSRRAGRHHDLQLAKWQG